MPKPLAGGDGQRGLGHFQRLKCEHKRETKRGVAFAALDNRLDDIARGPAFLDFLEGPIAKGEIRALERLWRKLVRPAIDVPIAPKLLLSPGERDANGQRCARLATVEI